MNELQESKNLSDEQIEGIFRGVDTDKAGTINYSKFVAAGMCRPIQLS